MKKLTPLFDSPLMVKIKNQLVGIRRLFPLLLLILILGAAAETGTAQTKRYVKEGATGNGSSWAAASGNLQAMINASFNGDQVLVFAGTYKPTTGTDRSISFTMKEGVAIYGGFTGTNQNSVTQRPAITFSNPSASILSGEIGLAGIGDNSYHVISNYENGLSAAAVLDGFVITGGNANADFKVVELGNSGGGMLNFSVSPIVRYCKFTSNHAQSGGAIWHGVGSNGNFINCNFSSNSAEVGGGAINTSGRANCSVVNSFFYGNAAYEGNAVYGAFSIINLTNCSFSGSSAGSVIKNGNNCTINVTNSIVWGNSTIAIVDVSGSISVSYSAIQEGYAGVGNLNADPLFVDAANGDFRLKSNSPVVNKGNNSANTTATDLDGNTRIFGATIDMGAFEFQGQPCTPPAITTQPVNITTCPGVPYRLSVAATGSPILNYEWQVSTNGGESWSSITSGNVPSITFSTPTVNMNGYKFRVLITNGCGTVTSDVIILTVNPVTVIATQPVAATKCTGDAVSFSVSAIGTGLTYQWKKNGTNISGATSSAYNLAAVSADDLGNYSVTVSGTCGSPVTSNAVALILNTAPAITAQPVSATKCEGEDVSFSVTAAGAGLSYQWKKNGTNIGGATAKTYTISSSEDSDAGNYSVTISGDCDPAVTSSPVALTINEKSVITSQPVALAKCTGENASFTIQASGDNLSYQWKKNGSNLSGATAKTYTISDVENSDAGNYSVTVSGDCDPAVTSSAVALTINEKPVITSQPVALAKCTGENASFTIQASGDNLSYQWKKNGSNLSGATAKTYTISDVENSDAGNYSVTVSGDCDLAVTSSAVALTVNEKPVITSQPVALAKCTGENASFTIQASGDGLSYQWKKNGSNISGATSKTYTIPAVDNSDAGNYSVTVSGDCGSPVTSSTASLTINTPPVAIITASGPTTICPNGAVMLTASPGASYIWSNGSKDPSIQVTRAGSFFVTITGAQGCTASSALTTISVDDNEAPVVVNLPVIRAECAVIVSRINGTDNCAGSIVPATNDPLTYNSQGTYIIHWKYDDGNGNSITKEQTVIIEDETKPVPAVAKLPDLTGCLVTATAPKATDNCAGTITATTTDPLTYTVLGTYTINWTYKDNNGNTSLQIQKVIVSGINKPIVTAGGNTTFCQGGSVTLSAPTGFTSYQWSNGSDKSSITVNASGSYSVTVTNASECSSTSDAVKVSVSNDTQKPVVTCTAATTLCYADNETYPIAVLQATDNCVIASMSYTITGATSRSGSGSNASGIFKAGTSTITWTVKDAAGNTSTCQSIVVINPRLNISIPDGWALGSGCVLNTVYKGYLPASYILLIATPTGGKSPYTYKWSNGSTAFFILVNPGSATTYSVTVKDAKGCTQTASKPISVVDVRCGGNLDKVSLCYKGNTLCTAGKDVAGYLLNGAYLGTCRVNNSSKFINDAAVDATEESDLVIKIAPNPSTTNFKLTVNSSNIRDKVHMTIRDAVGKVLETRTVNAGETIQIGDKYRAGLYFAEAVQGKKRVSVKLIKQGW